MRIKRRHIAMARACVAMHAQTPAHKVQLRVCAGCSRILAPRRQGEAPMTEFVSITIQWYPPGQFGPNECDLMRAMQNVVNLYKADTPAAVSFAVTTENTDSEIARAVDWLHAKYGSKP